MNTFTASPVMVPTTRKVKAGQQLHAATAIIAFSVFADSSLEHYRGGFYRPAMFIAPVVSGITLAAGLGGTRPSATSGVVRTTVYATATLTGLVGVGYHVANLARREPGRTWLNLFYGAPVAAPLAIHMAGVLGLLAGATDRRRDPTATTGGLRPSRAVGALVAIGLLGTAAEAALLHFRGAFQNPHMYLPVTIPPITCRRALRRPQHRTLPAAGARALAGDRGGRRRRRCVPRVWRSPQHGRLAELDAEHPPRTAAAGAAGVHGLGARRPGSSRPRRG